MSNQLELVLLGDSGSMGFTDPALFATQAKRVSDYLVTIEPFKSRAHQLHIASVLSPLNLGLSRSTTTSRLITVNQAACKQAVEVAGMVAEKGIVLANTSTYGGSGGATFCVAYCGLDGPKVAVHEFGHTLAALLDEYVSYQGGTVTNAWYRNAFRGPVGTGHPYAGCKYGAWSRAYETCCMRALGRPFCLTCQTILNAAIDLLAEPCVLPDPPASPTPVPTPTPETSGDPRLNLIYPYTDLTTTERLFVRAEAFAGVNPLKDVSLYIDDNLKKQITGVNVQNKWLVSWYWSVGNYASGTYPLRAVVTDQAGKVVVKTVEVTRP